MNITSVIRDLEAIKEFLIDRNHIHALSRCEELNDGLIEILDPHWNIQSSDDQYTDPEMWDFQPIYNDIQPILEILRFVDSFNGIYAEYERLDIEAMNDACVMVENIIEKIGD